jgi:hypothetical protein
MQLSRYHRGKEDDNHDEPKMNQANGIPLPLLEIGNHTYTKRENEKEERQ